MILSRVKFYPQERIDLEDLTTLLSAARTDAKLWTKQFLSGQNHVWKGFSVSGIGLKSATVEMDNATLILGAGSQDFSYFTAENNPDDLIIPDADLIDGARNYVELALTYEDGTPITKAFWDPSANGGLGAEFNQQVNTVTDLAVTAVVVQGGFTGNPDRVPLCIIDTDGTGNIKVILDQRNIFGRLGTPTDIDNEFTWASNEEPTFLVNITSPSGTFEAGETVTFSGGATAEVATGGTSNIAVRLPSGTNMSTGNTVTGGTSGATGTVNTIYENFTGADKDLSDLKEIISALQTEIKFLKGTRFWYQRQSNSLQGLTTILNSAIVGLTAGAKYAWSGSVLSITDNNVSPAAADALARIRLFGKSQVIQMLRQDGQDSTTTIAIADGQMLFVKLPATGNRSYSGVGTGDTNYQIVAANSYVANDTNMWIAYREGSKLYIRGYGELMSGESAEISDPISEQILTFIGATSEADDFPAYTSNNIVSDGDSLVEAISKLDQVSSSRGMKVIGGGTVSLATSSPTPTSLIANSSLTGLAYQSFQNTPGTNPFTPYAQSFLVTGPTAGNISSIDLTLRKVGLPDCDLYLEICADNAGEPGTVLGTSGLEAASGLAIAPSESLVSFTFSSPVNTTAATTYWFVLRATNIVTLDGGSNIVEIKSNNGQFANGTLLYDLDIPSIWTPVGGGTVDLIFNIAGQTGAGTGLELSFTDDMFLEIAGLEYADNTIPTSESPIEFPADGDVAYVVPNFVAAGPALTISVDSLDNVPGAAVIIARREGSSVIVGTSSTRLQDGQSSVLYAQTSDQTLAYIGAPDTAETAPTYSSNIRGTAGESLTARLGVLTDAIGDLQEDRSAFFRSQDPVSWDGSQLAFTSDIILSILNTKSGVVKTATVLVAGSPIALTDGQIAYISINRTLATQNVTVSVGTTLPAQTQANKDIIVLAYRKDAGGTAYLHIPLHKQVLVPPQTVRLGASGGLEKYQQAIVNNGSNVPVVNLNIAEIASARVEYRVRRKIADEIAPGGETWTSRTSAANVNYTSVTFAEGLFVAVGLNEIMTSPDGITWTSRTSPSVTLWQKVTHGNGTFVAVGENAVMTSPDGITWTSQTIPNAYWSSVIYAEGMFVAVGELTTTFNVATSPDGVTWTGQTVLGVSGLLGSITYGNGTFVALDVNIPSKTYTSPDGFVWTPHATPFDSAGYIREIGFGNGLFIAGGDSSALETSPDGINWTPITFTGQTGNASFRGIDYADDTYIVSSIQNADERIVTSQDGITWEVQTIPAGNARLKGIAHSTNTIVVVGSYSGSPLSDFMVITSPMSSIAEPEYELVEGGSFRVMQRPFDGTCSIGSFEFHGDDAGIEFEIDNSGQVTYDTTNLPLQENAEINYTIIPTS